MALTIAEIAKRLGAELVGSGKDPGHEIAAVQTVSGATDCDVTFITDARHEAALADSAAAAVIVAKSVDGLDMLQLVVADVNAALIRLLTDLAPAVKAPPEGVDPTAKLGANVQLGPGVSIGPHVVVADDVQIGPATVVGPGCTIGEGTTIGAHCRLDSHVVIYHHCSIGDHVVIQGNCTIGAVGFGYTYLDGAHRLFPHNGAVVIEDFVEIGANTCVDRGKFGNTIVGAGTKIDNLVQIGHNVVIGKHCLIASQVGVAGSCRLGDGVVLAGQVGLKDNIEIGAGVTVTAQAGVMGDVAPGETLAWSPAIPQKDALRVVGNVLRLPKIAQQLKRLKAKVDKLEAAEDHKGRG